MAGIARQRHPPRRYRSGRAGVGRFPRDAHGSGPSPTLTAAAARTKAANAMDLVLGASHDASSRRLVISADSSPDFGCLAQPPELKSLGIDGFFDGIAREIVGRSVVRSDRAGGGPGTMLLWEFAAREVGREGTQVFPRFRLEDVNPHGSAPFRG